ncbi:SPFH domain, Band 7 family protein [Ferrimonas balearica DSM 9799]|uniref:SPFH domain, Band 7 family protein n=1 Tax=Ferrimonas balearica (strain DSM 9799 / CCM 4581 / KCTC 23876 / PAT) TaxID=550540 RepID=E1SV81_FERBD|nr:SPFH domain-containing protein [Ferrimonas balearica]ADN77381.1 SPFH domain, Band 7 family protein [Ferrimonas balearica DSM 9799]MBW3139618.1 prohibitin family protein [Ferrimonas balearica]MBW3164656.1 prohibitin family protein [Ferrimonas balearica]MBY5980483.1 prohibitin family protein [Ferrimonas balearica]MBY6107262.1 prohibitin family protein [Ferrimonas balearica]
MDSNKPKGGSKLVFAIPAAVALMALATTGAAFYTIDEGHVGIVKRFGEAREQVNPGLHFKIPFADTVEELEIRTRKNQERLKAATHEQMPVEAEVSVNWTVNRTQAFDLFKLYGGLDQFENRILDPRLRSAAKEALAKYKAEQIIQTRGQVIADIETELLETMREFPVKLDSVQIENLILPAKYLQSIEIKQTEKNLAAAEMHKLERQKLEAQREVNTAEAQRDAEKARADGAAYAIITEAQAQAEAIRLTGAAEAEAMQQKADALANSERLVEYVKAQQWDGKMPSTIMGEGQSVLWNMSAQQ